MDNIYRLYCKILEHKTIMHELVPDDDGVILKMYKDILLIQYETLLKLLDQEIESVRSKCREKYE